MDALEELQSILEPAKKKRKAKEPETLDTSLDRLKSAKNIKWNEEESLILESVVAALRDGTLEWDFSAKKLHKKDVLELNEYLSVINRKRKLDELVRTKPANYKVITQTSTFKRFLIDLYREPLTVWDTETTGLDIILVDTIVGYSVWLPNADYGVYVPFGHGAEIIDVLGRRVVQQRFTGQLQETSCLQGIKDYLEDPEFKTVWHNAKYDLHLLANHGIDATPSLYYDTQVAANLLNEKESHKLKDLTPKYCGVEADHFATLFGDDPTIWDKPFEPSGVYAIKDVWFTFLLYQFQIKHLDRLPGLHYVFWEIEMPQVAASLEMERTGFALDIKRCKELEAEFGPIVEDALHAVHDAFNTQTTEFLETMSEKLSRKIDEFNIASPEQLAYLVYDFLELPDISKSVNPKLQPRSTAAAVLEKLVEIDERLEPLIDYREKEKLLSTYVRKFPEALAPDGRLHYQLVQFGTDTGRYSSKQYGGRKKDEKKGVNIQNIPSRTKAAKKVKTVLIPDPGWLILTSDLSQIEPRVLADMSGDKKLQLPYNTGADLYVQMAMDLYEFEREYCIDGAYDPEGNFQPRKRSKTGLLAAMYGTSKWTLSQQMRITVDAAEEFLENFFETYADVKRFIDDTQAFVLKHEYVETKYGRKRRFPGLKKDMARRKQLEKQFWKNMNDEDKAELKTLRKNTNGMLRAACNARIQGTAADVMKLIVARMFKLAKRKGWKLIATVHDEINIMVPASISPEDVAEVEAIMTETVTLAVPMKCDTTIGRNWGDETPWREFFENLLGKEAA